MPGVSKGKRRGSRQTDSSRIRFDAFPEYKQHDLYLSGESYAGVYIPMLAEKIYDGNKQPGAATHLKLAGFAVGDGVLGHGDTAGGPQFTIDFFYGQHTAACRSCDKPQGLNRLRPVH